MASTTQQARTGTPNMSNSSNKSRATANGVAPRHKLSTEPRQTTRDNLTSDKQAHDRLLFLIANMVGVMATVVVKNGDKFTGVLSGASLQKENADASLFVLKMTKRIPSTSGQANGSSNTTEEYVGTGEEYIMIFSQNDIIDLSVENLSLEKSVGKNANSTAAGFRTDTDISGNLAVRERELQAWQPTLGESKVDMSMTGGGQSRAWDQFETNERITGMKTDYDESFYTTTIDRSAPSYRNRVAAADKLAREIESTVSSNPHIAEERGQTDATANGADEEDRFSGVRRDFMPLQSTQSNRYTPPARRAPTGQATVNGAPVDPAIITAQLARPDSAKQGKSFKDVVAPSVVSKEGSSEFSTVNKPGADTTAGTANTTSQSAEIGSSAPISAVREQSAVLEAISPKAAISTRQAGTTPAAVNSALNNVEGKVVASFRSFVAGEKLRMAEHEQQRLARINSKQRMSAQKDRDIKFSDLKQFATSFKLKTAVPQDMLGILAKDKAKQTEIIEKSKRQLEEQDHEASAKASQPSTPSAASRSSVSTLPTIVKSPPATTTTNGQNGMKPSRLPPLEPVTQGARTDRTVAASAGGVVSPRAVTGNLGQRLMAQHQQYRNSSHNQGMSEHPQSAIPASPNVTTGLPASRHASIASVSTSKPAQLNVQAMEFKPNPAAMAFSPSLMRGSVSSPDKGKPVPQVAVKPTNRVSFFGDKRPGSANKKTKLRAAFNPLPRLKKEGMGNPAYVSNDGIPFSYRTQPTWDTTEENREKTYLDMFEKPQQSNVISQTATHLPHHQQLPVQMQHGNGPIYVPGQQMQGGPGPMPHQGRDHRFDEHRMQYSPSQQSGYPSPRMPVMMPYQNGQMASPTQAQFGQSMPPYAMGPNGQPIPYRPFPGNAQFVGSPGAAYAGVPMAIPQGAYVMSPQMHGMPSPAQAHVNPNFYQQNPGQHGFGSPRAAPMMMQQGSHQGPMPGQFVYMQQPQHPGQMFPGHQPQTPHMRNGGGVPMMHQNSFGGHGPPQFQRQYSSHGANNYNNNNNSPQQQQPPPPHSPMAQNSPMPHNMPLPQQQQQPPAPNGVPNGTESANAEDAAK